MECGSHRGINLMADEMKVLERVVDKRLRSIVDIDGMQFGFMKGEGSCFMGCEGDRRENDTMKPQPIMFLC